MPDQEIQDVCFELFGGGCGVYSTLDEMMACPRQIRTCDVFIPAFREAVALRLEKAKKPAPPAAAPKTKKPAPQKKK